MLDMLDDPNDPAPELELLEEWERVFGESSSSASDLDLNRDTLPHSDDEIAALFGIDLNAELEIAGLPASEYMERYTSAMEAEDWQAIADLWHVKLDYFLIKTLNQIKAKHEL